MTYQDFEKPDGAFYPRPLWFWNDRPTEETMAAIMDTAEEKSAYGGFGILAYDACQLEYMGKDYLDAYAFALKKAKELGLKLCLYDEWWFPSGSAGGLLKKKYPEACARELVKTEYPVSGHVELTFSEGTLMAVVAMNENSREIIDLKGCLHDGTLRWDTDEDGWRVLVFTCVLSNWDHVNYLDSEAVKKFIEVTHEVYYERFSEYFGNVIDSSFYDEPQMYAVGGRMWVDNFNELFLQRYGFEPDLLYPALWYDIGETTASARAMLHGLRNDLYANGFPKVIQEWCSAHGISLTGHVDQEEMVNPTGITGDLMKSFQYQDIPGFDEIMQPGRGSKIYKLVSSAANNWDKEKVMSECYGAMDENISIETMYHEAMEQYAKGMTLFVPHAVWLNPEKEKIVFHPELSWRNDHFKGQLKPLNEFCARMSKVLTGGRHVSDIAVLYPIYGLNAAYYFEWGEPYQGGPAPDYLDYQKIGDWLSRDIRKDFTYLHPEALDERCSVEAGKLCLNNRVNREAYQVVILPGTTVMSVRNLEKIKAFVQSGGTVIATSRLPEHSAEPGKDRELQELIADLFGAADGSRQPGEARSRAEQRAADGNRQLGETGDWAERCAGDGSSGRAVFLAAPTPENLKAALAQTKASFDVEMRVEEAADGIVTYIHKQKDGQDFYYFINCNPHPVTTEISLRGELQVELWNPHDGSREKLDATAAAGRTQFRLTIPADRSILVTAAESSRD